MKPFFETLAGRKVAFIGAGVAHRELIALFAKAGAAVTLCDKKTRAALGAAGDELAALGVRLCLGEGYLEGLTGQDMILRTPGFYFYTPQLQAAKAAGALVTSEIELFFEHCPCQIVAVTGSDGKTTTTSLIAAMYAEAGRTVHLGGNIGRALLPIVDTIAPGDVAAVELSSFQLISMRTAPDIAVVTNVTPNHLDHHKDMDEYVNAKRNILLHQDKNSVAVLGYENGITRGMAAGAKGEARFFSHKRPVESGAFLDDAGMLYLAWPNKPPLAVLPRAGVRLLGTHNIQNLLAAMAALRDEVSPETMRRVAESFAGVEHRIEPVREAGGVRWINHSIATSPGRTVAGLRCFNSNVILIAGGSDKKLPFEPMAEETVRRVKLLLLCGPTGPAIEAAVRAHPAFAKSGMRIAHASGLENAVALAARAAQPGDVVLLSPASPSFDAYDNFEERGRHFKALVNALEGKP